MVVFCHLESLWKHFRGLSGLEVLLRELRVAERWEWRGEGSPGGSTAPALTARAESPPPTGRRVSGSLRQGRPRRGRRTWGWGWRCWWGSWSSPPPCCRLPPGKEGEKVGGQRSFNLPTQLVSGNKTQASRVCVVTVVLMVVQVSLSWRPSVQSRMLFWGETKGSRYKPSSFLL